MQRQAWGAETSATSPETQGAGTGSRNQSTLDPGRGGRPGEPRQAPQAPRRSGELRGGRSPHKSPRRRRHRKRATHVPTQQASSSGAGRRSTGNDPRDKSEAGGSEDIRRGPL
uniref:Uncharacterized protein n=1 Tax=Rangifer tarandus platyrhynchus TaxID=3082113 RepID=A0ACB0E8J4_RANTA|nr:unnamed protein product [Rangifer tarandus platyrhynchus]